MAATCQHCGYVWTAARVEHCVALDGITGDRCCASFTGSKTGDTHRVGDHNERTGSDRRRCLSEAEMRAAGLDLDERGIWFDVRDRQKARDRRVVDPQGLYGVALVPAPRTAPEHAEIASASGPR